METSKKSYSVQDIHSIRKLYRNYLAKFALFRFLKNLILSTWWFLREIRYAISLLKKPRSFYRVYLSQYLIFRKIKKILLWFYFISPVLINKFRFLLLEKRSFALVSMSDYLKQEKLNKFIISTSESNNIAGPKFFGDYPVKLDAKSSVNVNIPDIYLAEINKAVIVGGTNLTLANGFAIYPDLMNIDEEIMPIEIYGLASANEKRINISITRNKKVISKAISLVDQFSGNYAHWLTEILPKLTFLDDLDEYKGFPLLVDGWNHPVFHESIKMFNKQNRELIFVNRWEPVRVNRLVQLSASGYIQAELRSHIYDGKWTPPHENSFRFSKVAFDKIRNRVASLVDKDNANKKVYLVRNPESTGNGRFILNLTEVEEILEEYGFEPFDITGLSFEDQVRAFAQFKYIVSPIGAVLANTIFSPEGSKVIILSPYYENASYYFFSNLIGILGYDHRYVLGPQTKAKGHIGHRNYTVDIKALKGALDNFMNDDLC